MCFLLEMGSLNRETDGSGWFMNYETKASIGKSYESYESYELRIMSASLCFPKHRIHPEIA